MITRWQQEKPATTTRKNKYKRKQQNETLTKPTTEARSRKKEELKARTKGRAHERAIKRGNQNEGDSTTSMSKLCQHSQLSSSSRDSPASLKANKGYKRRKRKEKQRKRLEKEILTKWIPDTTDKEGNGHKKSHVPLNVESPKVGKSNQEYYFKGKSLSKELIGIRVRNAGASGRECSALAGRHYLPPRQASFTSFFNKEIELQLSGRRA